MYTRCEDNDVAITLYVVKQPITMEQNLTYIRNCIEMMLS